MIFIFYGWLVFWMAFRSQICLRLPYLCQDWIHAIVVLSWYFITTSLVIFFSIKNFFGNTNSDLLKPWEVLISFLRSPLWSTPDLGPWRLSFSSSWNQCSEMILRKRQGTHSQHFYFRNDIQSFIKDENWKGSCKIIYLF